MTLFASPYHHAKASGSDLCRLRMRGRVSPPVLILCSLLVAVLFSTALGTVDAHAQQRGDSTQTESPRRYRYAPPQNRGSDDTDEDTRRRSQSVEERRRKALEREARRRRQRRSSSREPDRSAGPSSPEARRSGARSSDLRPRASRRPARSDTSAQPVVKLSPASMPAAARDTIRSMNVRGADLRDVLRGIGAEHGLNLIVDDAVQQRVTVRLSNLPVIEAVEALCREHGLSLVQRGTIFRIGVPNPPAPPAPKPPQVAVEGGRLTVDLEAADLRRVVRALAEASGENVIVRQGVNGRLSGFLQDVPFESGFATLLENNGLKLRTRGEIYVVERGLQQLQDAENGDAASMWVTVENQRIDIEAREAPVKALLGEIADQMSLNLVTYDAPEGRLTASVSDLNLDETLTLLFKGTDVTYRREGDTYYIGRRQTSGIATTRLIKLDHMKADGIPKLIPPALKQGVTLQVIPEYNALMVSGTNDVIREIEAAVQSLDQPTPLILIEALVVDFQSSDLFELGFEFGQDQQKSEQAKSEGYSFGEDGVRFSAEDERGNFYLDKLKPVAKDFGIANIGKLPQDFFFKLRALSQEGKVEIRSRPQIATLSGHTASLSIGTTQYFILRKETPIQSPGGGVVVQETERFEQIEANVSLEVTPWVTASGEVTTEIRPEFSTPVGAFQPDVPPTINSRVFESTVRLRDGETIILGGLIQDEETVRKNKIPLLGSIPLLGRLFQSRSTDTEKSELIVYLTPRIFYGSEAEAAKWKQYREENDLPEPKD